MIRIQNVKKCFGTREALSLSLTIPEGGIFGLLGTNGAGKSTLLRLLAGILRPEEGEVLLEDTPLWENEKAKENLFLVSDDAWFPAGATPLSLCAYYEALYPAFDRERFFHLCREFSLERKKPLHTFSKGMRKQVMVLLGLCSKAPYLLCDETFDGLDPVIRQAVKSLFAGELLARPFTPVIATHNLRELEDFCDQLCLLHEGKLILEGSLEEKKRSLHRIQCAFADPAQEDALLRALPALSCRRQGKLLLLTVRGEREEVEKTLKTFRPVYAEVLPLTLEEIFITETEAYGYEINLV